MPILDDVNGTNITPMYGSLLDQMEDYGQFGIGDMHASGIQQVGRDAYVYDQTHGALWKFNLDAPLGGTPAGPQYQMIKVLDLPQCTFTGAGRGIQIVYHPVKNLMLIYEIMTPTGYALDLTANTLSTWQRTDGFINGVGTWVPPSYLLYDPDTQDVFSIGGIDWDTSMVCPNYWRHHFA